MTTTAPRTDPAPDRHPPDPPAPGRTLLDPSTPQQRGPHPLAGTDPTAPAPATAAGQRRVPTLEEEVRSSLLLLGLSAATAATASALGALLTVLW